MKSMTLAKTGAADSRPLEPFEAKEPAPGAGQVLVQVEACGVCRTDLHIVEGEVSAALPIIPGHQVVGTVLETGPGVPSVQRGARVGIGWLHSACGSCSHCRAGKENLCARARFTGRDVDGGYAQRMVADERFVYPLPDALSPVDAAPLLCAGIIGYRSLKLSGIRPGGRLGLVGFGASAHLAIQVALHWGCEVFAFDRKESHRKLALEKGARWAGWMDDDPGVLLDAAITFAPAGELIGRALDLLDRGGTVAVNAIHMTDLPALRYEQIYWEKAVRSVANFTRQDAREFLALAAEIPVRADTERFSLEDANEALIRVKAGAIRGAAVLDAR
ncbi:MAG: zinc-dependent alcohol dehydrogenase family protein [Deltaproteobacteria bacterium]|nr:zinc-dependent alcohol dehydrogenase family protein [Deltaproteobacteria bacterium]